MEVRLKKNSGLIFNAIPDAAKVAVRVATSGRLEHIWPNSLVLSDRLKKYLALKSVNFYFPPPTPASFKNVEWIINTCADADEYSSGLLGLDDAFGTSARIFNHPRAVVASRRDKVSSLLAGIDGLEVPKCIRFVPKKSQDFQKAFADTGMAYPVLVRPAASQTGRGLVRVDSPFDWVKALESHWYGVPHFMTQYVEYKNAFSHLYEKARVVVIGDQLFLRAYSTSPEWLVKGLPKDLTTSEAIDILNGFNSFSAGDGGWSALRFVANEIKSRLPLDFFGIDLGVRGDGTFVLFEANVAMNILTTSAPKGPKEFIERIIIGLEQPIKHYLEHPATWRHDASLLPSVREALNNSVSSTAR